MTRQIKITMTLEEAAQLNGVPIPGFLYDKVQSALTAEALEFERDEEIRRVTERERARRAENHVLTERQAQALCALKHGKYTSMVPVLYTNGTYGWYNSLSMSRAVNRMVEKLVDEGMIAGNGRELTQVGAERLAAYEAKHGVLYDDK